MGFAACDEYTLPNPPAQSNPEEPVFDSADLVVTSDINGQISLPALNADRKPVTVFNYTLSNFPSSYDLEIVAEFCADDAFEKVAEVKTTVTDEGTVTIPVAEVQSVFNALISKDLVAKDLYVRYPAYAVNGTTRVRLGGPDTYYGGEFLKYDVLPIPQANVVEPRYYFVTNANNWSISEAIPMTQLTEGNPYDNPEFTVKIDVDVDMAESTDGYRWEILPESSFIAGNLEGAFGVADGGSETEGNLLPIAEGSAHAGVIAQEGPYMVKINMETRKFEVGPAFDYLWVPGMGSSTTDFKRIMRLTTNDYINYEGTMRLASRFWFLGQESTKGVSFRPDGEQEENAKGVVSGKMIYDVSSTTMMRVPSTGLWLVRANVVTLDWSITPIKVIALIGAYNEWTLDTALDLEHDSRYEKWSIKGVNLPAGEFKFCVDHSWDLSYGGTPDGVRQNGSNFSVAEAGVYDLELNFAVFPNTLTITKK